MASYLKHLMPPSTEPRERFNSYRKPGELHVDCAAMWPLEQHLWHLAEILDDLSLEATEDSLNHDARVHEWPRISRWLKTAAGLRCVDIDTAFGEPHLPLSLCGVAADYYEAASNVTSAYMTEQTRLHYAWNAMERLLEVLRPDSVQQAPGRYNAATKLLNDHWGDSPRPEHFDCVSRHLRQHVEHDPELREQMQIQKALLDTPWRGPSGTLLSLASQLRHLPAHGDLDFPEPTAWGDSEPEPVEQLGQRIHAPRLACRGLLLSIPMLLVARPPAANLTGLCTPRSGWWVRPEGGTWNRHPNPGWQALLRSAHLRPPDCDTATDQEYGLYDEFDGDGD